MIDSVLNFIEECKLITVQLLKCIFEIRTLFALFCSLLNALFYKKKYELSPDQFLATNKSSLLVKNLLSNNLNKKYLFTLILLVLLKFRIYARLFF